MVKNIILAFPKEKKKTPKNQPILNISEMFSQTIQGEGIHAGHPSTFLRLQNCTLNCTYCDTSEVWRKGNSYTINEVISLMEKYKVIKDLSNGHHLVLTGGSPLLQQESLGLLLDKITETYKFKPFVEIENECTRMPNECLTKHITTWNNSPKLQSSGMDMYTRFKPNILRYLTQLNDSWFKFVITSQKDWDQIYNDFLIPGLIKKERIILMPEGSTREQLQKNYDLVVELVTTHNLKMSDRLQVTIWNKTTGV